MQVIGNVVIFILMLCMMAGCIGAVIDPAMWGGILLPPDMGGNILIHSMSSSNETWIIALFTSFILGSGVTFGIPMSISMPVCTGNRSLSVQ